MLKVPWRADRLRGSREEGRRVVGLLRGSIEEEEEEEEKATLFNCVEAKSEGSIEDGVVLRSYT